jgi:hypothetical protein
MYHKFQMRRALSILLLLFFGLGPLAATLQAGNEETRLPACCRRLGAHHCATQMDMGAAITGSASGKIVLKAPSTCPKFPSSTPATTSAPQALLASSPSLPALLAHSHSPAASRVAACLIQIRTRSGRAPPAFSLSQTPLTR